MIQVIHGKLENYSKARLSENFAINEAEGDALGGMAILASIAGMAGQAASTAATASDANEPADFVRFTLDGKPISGWLWFSPFNEGDEITAVVRKENEKYVAYAVLRPRDRLIALYPHCSRGKNAHWKAVFRGLFKWGVGFLLLMLFIFAFLDAFAALSWNDWLGRLQRTIMMSIYFVAPFLLFAAVLLGWKWMKFVRLSEIIFSALNWTDVRNIDLVARSKAAPLDQKVSFLVKDPGRDREELINTMSPADARLMSELSEMTDSERMRIVYGAAFFRY